MKLLSMFACGILAAAMTACVWPGALQAQQVVVVEGELTPECPFGICPVTNKPRTANDFYILFGYLPKSAGNFPGIPTTPPRNWPKTYYTPRPGTTPTTSTSSSPPANTVPNKPAAKKAVQPAANSGTGSLGQLTKDDAARMKGELQTRNGKLLDDLTARLATAPGGATAPRTVAARTAIDTVRTRVGNGTLANADLVNLVDALTGVVANDVIATIGQMAVNQQVFAWLQTARVGVNPIPDGANVPIALIPGLQAGMIIPLGFGPTLVGMGRGIDTIILGEGNVLQAAGLPAPDGPPLDDNEKPLAVGAVILTNVAEGPVNYTVNGSRFSMQPKYSQSLDAGRTWSVEFDRGGTFGTAQYQVKPGWYEFTETEKGWELFRKSFDVQLENLNDFDFQFVVDDQTRTLAAGRTEQFTGDYPPVLRFDDATGRVRQKRLTGDKQFHVALTSVGALEIYPASSVPAPPKPESFAGSSSPAPATVSTDSTAPAAAAFKLPAGFMPLDPVELLTPGEERKIASAKIPAAFTMFALAEGDK